MMMWYAFAIILHLLAINVWVGGTFFSVVVLNRAIACLEPSQRNNLMKIVLQRFFFCIWIAMFILLGSGGWLIYSVFGGLDTLPLYVVLMMVVGLLMMIVF